jgi:hypothetical protein
MKVLALSLFSFNQKIEQKEPEKKIPSTAANATKRSAKDPFINPT